MLDPGIFEKIKKKIERKKVCTMGGGGILTGVGKPEEGGELRGKNCSNCKTLRIASGPEEFGRNQKRER